MLKLPNLRKPILLAALFLLFTGCNDNATTVTETDLTASTQSSQVSSMQEDTNGLKNLMLTIDKTTLNKDDNTTLKVMATYEDGTNKDVTDEVEWVVSPESSVVVTQRILIAKKDNPTILKAKLENILSNSIHLDITWIVDDYTLPPEPDKVVNDSTLLGVDVNGNGVRDDVERYIYERFGEDPEYPKTKVALAMQYAWSTQKILETPTIESKKYLDDSLNCESYWIDTKTKNMSGLNYIKYSEKHKVFNDVALKDKFLNTKLRILQKFKFNEACSGHIFHGRKSSINNCQTNIDILGE